LFYVHYTLFFLYSILVLAALYDSTLTGFDIFGVVKETGVDDEGLSEFSHSYFGNFPLYCDKSYSFYSALGDRKLLEFPSMWTLMTSFFDAWQRVTRKKIKWNTKGEGIVKGGIIVFDKRGKPRYAYQEEMGIDLPVQDLLSALESMRREEDQQQQHQAKRTTKSVSTTTTQNIVF
jgi:hypothetical protein